MVMIQHRLCLECGERRSFSHNEPMCFDCMNKFENEKLQNFLSECKSHSLEERIESLEKHIYTLNKERNYNMLF